MIGAKMFKPSPDFVIGQLCIAKGILHDLWEIKFNDDFDKQCYGSYYSIQKMIQVMEQLKNKESETNGTPH